MSSLRVSDDVPHQAQADDTFGAPMSRWRLDTA